MNRHVLAIFGVCLLAILAGAALIFFKPTLRTSVGTVPFSVVTQGEQSGSIDTRKNYRIHTFEEYQALWFLMYGGNAPALPSADFSSNEILAVFDGTHPSGGYDVTVDSIVDGEGKRVVTITHQEPGPSCIVTQAVTSPFVFIMLPKNPDPIVRTDVNVVTRCP